MGETAMQLNEEQMNAIGDYVRLHLREWLGGDAASSAVPEREMVLRERIVRVEESLDKQYELMKQGFDMMERRFESIEKRFEQVEKRFEQVDKRFEQVDKRFEQVDKRIEDLRSDMNQRFKQMFAYTTTGVVLLGVLMSVYQFLS